MRTPPPAIVEAVVATLETIAIRLRLRAARDEGWQTIDIACILHRRLLLRTVMIPLLSIVITRLLIVALLVGLRIARLKLRLLLRLRGESRFLPEV